MPIVVGVTTLAHLPYFLIGVNDSFIGDNLTERLIQCLAMQKPLPTPSQPEPENKCLGCLFMKLEGIPVSAREATEARYFKSQAKICCNRASQPTLDHTIQRTARAVAWWSP
jgi:hypothetical protein